MLYAALAAVDAALSAAPARWQRARVVTKPLLVPALAASSTGRPAQPGGRALRAAQALSWGGDVALMREDKRFFLLGLSSFLAAHVSYIAACRARSSAPLLSTPGRRRMLAGLGVATSGMAVAAGRHDRALALPVAAYGLTLATMATAASAVDPDQGRAQVLAGALVFMASDTLLGIRNFVLPGQQHLLEPVVMATYATAQRLIADGLTRPTGDGVVRGC